MGWACRVSYRSGRVQMHGTFHGSTPSAALREWLAYSKDMK